MEVRQLTCIVCPRSCRLSVDGEGRITGHGCKRGYEYAQEEISEPKRMLTTTISVKDGVLARLPVVSTRAIPRRLLPACLAELARVTVPAPVSYGDVIVKNIQGTGVDIIAARNIEKRVG